jgi:hypothetical protein
MSLDSELVGSNLAKLQKKINKFEAYLHSLMENQSNFQYF